ncbi:MAG: class I SAM-dependent RNA methyltransferase [Chitinophagia bacterium]|jgi:putative N6-adenine-specific DNA methylase|nr:class I SAM-dependent RNA methyltransferase [Chitinophagia bacterium]
MQLWNTKGNIVITCHKWLSPALLSEVQALGFTTATGFTTGVRISGSLDDCILLNLRLRSASQVLFQVHSFPCNHPDDIYETLVRFPWENWLMPETYFSVTAQVSHPSINNNMFAGLRVKDAWVDRCRRLNGKRPDTGSELSGAVIHLFWKGDQATVFIDTSGASLGRHGYRKIPGKAPMLEALAAAVILSTRWNKKAPFINPMCGSGTLAIEAALIASGRVPGLFRNQYGFQFIKGYSNERYLEERKKIENQITEKDIPVIIASDISEAAIANAAINAEKAGVAHLIKFELGDFAATSVPEQPGIILFNPEYGERLGEIQQLEKLYARIGDFLKHYCQGYLGYVFTGNLELAKQIHLKPSRRIPFYNATIECRLLEYEMYAGSKRG